MGSDKFECVLNVDIDSTLSLPRVRILILVNTVLAWIEDKKIDENFLFIIDKVFRLRVVNLNSSIYVNSKRRDGHVIIAKGESPRDKPADRTHKPETCAITSWQKSRGNGCG